MADQHSVNRQRTPEQLNRSGHEVTITPEQSTSASGLQPSGGQHTSLAQILDLALHSPPRPVTAGPSSASSLVALGECLPLIPKRVVERIQEGDYIDFSELSPVKGKVRAPPPHWEGHILVVQLEDLEGSKRLIPDFQTWTQCFVIFAAALLKRYPEKAAALMAYMYEMAKNARKFKWPSWVIYDQNFRQKMATKPGLDWASIDSTVYAESFMHMNISPTESWCKTCQSIDHPSSACPVTPRPPKRRRLTEIICRNYNTKGCSYNGCRYAHKCSNCKGAHPASSCTSRPVESGVARDRSTQQ